MSNEIKMSERFGSVPNFDIREFMDDDRTFVIPNVDLCYDDINKAVNTHDQHLARIAELELALISNIELFEMLDGETHPSIELDAVAHSLKQLLDK